ncbi:MAG: HlyD family efflux transporter periplasmic adaptor subunit [Bacteroidales bacterium]|nr:HlyD family efflux transporter periplasmic adaptor subunit [Bacteroidales bacterium]
MDIKIAKRPWYIRNKYSIMLGAVVLGLIIYAIVLSFGPRTFKVNGQDTRIAKVEDAFFMEYVDAEGVVKPISTIRINALESGTLAKIVAEDGAMLRKGDSILFLENVELMRTIDDERDEWQKQYNLLQEQKLSLEQKVISLRQQTLDAQYELSRLDKDLAINREEFKMGIVTKAQLDMKESEYTYRHQKTELQLQSLLHDSAATVIRQKLLESDFQRVDKRYERSRERMENMVVRATTDGQFSFGGATLGQRIMAGEAIGEIKVMTSYKMSIQLNEYYIDRVSSGLPARITYQDQKYELKVSRVVPEVKNHSFEVELVFTGDMPSNVRLGKSYRVQVELGQQEKATVIPRGDFYATTGGKWIFKLTSDGKRAVKVPVTIGRQNPKQYEVLDGLEPGDEVILTGYSNYGEAEELKIDD